MTAPFMVQTISGDSAIKINMAITSSHAILQQVHPAISPTQDHTEPPFSMDFQDKSKLQEIILKLHSLRPLTQEARPATAHQYVTSTIPAVILIIQTKTTIPITTKVSMSSKVMHKKSMTKGITYLKGPS